MSSNTLEGTEWRGHYDRCMTTPEDIVGRIGSGDVIYTVVGHECPVLIAALIARAHEVEGVRIRRVGGFWEDYGIYTDEWSRIIRANVSFATPPSRAALAAGFIDYTVVGFGDVHRAIDQGRAASAPYDFCWLTVGPPDHAGYCSAGAELWDLRTAMRRSRVTVAGINRHLPVTFGDTKVHVSEIDLFFEQHEEPRERQRRPPKPAARVIAQHVSSLVRDGDTIQIGAGATTFALGLLGAFDEKNDLGYFAETAPPGILDLVKRGVITSKHATLHPERFVTTAIPVEGADDVAYIDRNPFFEFYDYDYMLDPSVIGRNDNMVAINNALAVDLLGQVAVSSIGPTIHSGTGGQLGYHMGAFLSRGGRAVTVLPATSSDGAVSRIVHRHGEGQIVTVPWDLADTVVTEYGVAELLGKSMRERAEALIAVAHPDARDELRTALKGGRA